MKRTAAIAALAASLALLPSCSPQPDTTSTPTPVVTTTAADTPTPTESPPTEPPEPSQSPSETLDAAQIAGRDVVARFFELYDELRRDPNLSIQPLADMTLDEVQSTYLGEIRSFREANAVLVGEIAREIISVAPATLQDGDYTVVVEACTDSSEADVVDVTTRESILPADRKPLVHWTLEAVSRGETNWFVSASVTDLTGGTCSP